MNDNRAAIRLRDACAHDEAADRHMQAAVLWRDLGQPQQAILEVKCAMAERQLAQLERDRAKLEERRQHAAAKPPAARRTVPAIAHEHRTTTKGAVEVIHADGLWRVVWDGDPDADSTHESRITAIVVAHERAREARCELVIQTRDGTTREHVSYRDDPTEQRVIYREPRLRRA